MDYLIPGRRSGREALRSDSTTVAEPFNPAIEILDKTIPQLTVYPSQQNESIRTSTANQETRRTARLVASRSFSNLRSAPAEAYSKGYHAPGLPKSSSSTALVSRRSSMELKDVRKVGPIHNTSTTLGNAEGDDALEMRQRSAQKTFVHVKIPR